jgi:hypothetical protein
MWTFSEPTKLALEDAGTVTYAKDNLKEGSNILTKDDSKLR